MWRPSAASFARRSRMAAYSSVGMGGRCRNRREACNDLSPRARVVQLTPPRCHGSLRTARRGCESREMSARRCCAASVLRAMRCQRAIRMRANASAGTRRFMCMRHSLKHRAQHLAPIERANRATVHLRVRTVLKTQQRAGLARFLPHDPDRSSTDRQSARVQLRRGADFDAHHDRCPPEITAHPTVTNAMKFRIVVPRVI